MYNKQSEQNIYLLRYLEPMHNELNCVVFLIYRPKSIFWTEHAFLKGSKIRETFVTV